MAFTSAQRVKIRRYWGSAGGITGSDPYLESAIDRAGADAAWQAEVESILAKLAIVETEIEGLHGIALAEKVEESTLNKDRYRDLRTAGRRECYALAKLLGFKAPAGDAFAAGWSGGPMGMG